MKTGDKAITMEITETAEKINLLSRFVSQRPLR
jgi:hypothetical protein